MAAWQLNDWLSPWVAIADKRRVGAPTLDSRRLTPSGVFLACAGLRQHGLSYLEAAIGAGASAVIWEPAEGVDGRWVESVCQEAGVAAVPLDQLARRAGHLAARYYGEPGEALTLIGVTGTDGKTSVTQFVARALGGEGLYCGLIGTMGWGWPDQLAASSLTTPDAVTLQAWLARLREQGARCVAMEVSSHALAQDRVAALHFDVAVLTSLGHDHLDYHGTLADYRAAKRRLFDLGKPVPVLNLDDAWGSELAMELAPRAPIGYGMSADALARVVCQRFEPDSGGMHVVLMADGAPTDLWLPILGRFNAANVSATAAALLAAGVAADELGSRLAQIRPVAGRMEPVTAPAGPTVVVDYAHTPGALTAALTAAREHCAGRVWLVFGCGGERDRGKRAAMGRIAARDADRVVLTNDNPRNEDPERIIAAIREPMDADVAVVLERAEAIQQAVSSAEAEDCVLIAGKGHEAWQVTGDTWQPFSDREHARAALGEAC